MRCKFLVFIHCRQHLIIMLFMFGPRPSSNTSMEKRIEQSSIPYKEKAQTFKPTPINVDLPFKSSVNTQNIQGTNLVEEYFQWTIQYPMEGSEDLTLALEINLTPIPNEKKRFIDFEDFSTYLLNYAGTDFPTGISLACAQMSGYVNQHKVATHVVANTMPFSVTSVINPGGIVGYNVLYKNTAGVIWDITNQNVLSFRIKLFGDTNYRPLPSAQPLQVTCKITRVVF